MGCVSDVIFQTYLRKLKFQYLEQNAKDKYVKSIVSDIDDAPIVTAEQNKELAVINQEKKEKLKAAKDKLAEMQSNIRILAPMVEQGTLFFDTFLQILESLQITNE